MRNNRWGLIPLALCLVLSLASCSRKAPEETGDGTVISSYSSDDYQTLMPHELSEGRYWRGNTNSRFDLMQMPKELIELSKQHFSVKDNYLQAGQILEYEDIQELQRYESSDHSYGLNPSGNFEISDAIILERPYIVYGIVEIDFIAKEDQKTLNGISVGILMNSSVTSGDSTVEIPQDKLYTYASTIGRKLERYFRNKAEVDADLPIYITFYSSNSTSSSVPGAFIGQGLFTSRSGQFTPIEEQWVLIPSDQATALDGVLSSQFSTVKAGVKDFMPENVNIIGKARYTNDTADYLKITVTVQAKSYTEIYSLMQLLNELSVNFSSTDMELIIEIKQLEETVMILHREKGTMKTTVLDIS